VGNKYEKEKEKRKNGEREREKLKGKVNSKEGRIKAEITG
jgi:hypothetical protein